MNVNFHFSRATEIPKGIQELKTHYYLKKTASKPEGTEWELRKTRTPSAIKNIYMSTINSMNRAVGKSNVYVFKEDLTAIMEIAANPKEKHISTRYVEVLRNCELKRLSENLEFQSISRSVIGEGAKSKLKRAGAKASGLGRGLCKMSKNGFEGKILSDEYMIEQSTINHLYQIDELKEEWLKAKTPLPFGDWLDRNYKTDSLHQVEYLTDDNDRLPYRLEFNEGKVRRDSKPFNTANETTEHSGDGFAIFVIDGSGNFYAGSHVRGQFHHSSFLGGAAILGAGEIQTDPDGTIIGISNKSGHYKPGTDQILNTLKLLEKSNIDLSKIKVTQLSKEGPLVYKSAKEYLEQKGQGICDGHECFFMKKGSNGAYALILNDSSISKRDKIDYLKKTCKFYEDQFKIIPTSYREILSSGKSVEYSLKTYIDNKGNTSPQLWEGGELKFEDGKLGRIIPSPSSTKDDELSFLRFLARSGIDISTVNIVKEKKEINAEEYFKTLQQTYS